MNYNESYPRLSMNKATNQIKETQSILQNTIENLLHNTTTIDVDITL